MDMANNIQKAIDFIEDNICYELKPEIIASQAYMSTFHFQRIFSVICNVSLGEYIRNRRLSLAGIDIISSNVRIIDIAFKYGYESPESFSRAFTRFHGISPMSARNRKGHINSFAKISVKNILGGNSSMERERGYTIKENGPVYYTENMDITAEWFENVLGWYTGIDQRDDNGDGTYGCALPFPAQVHSMALVPFYGFHMFYGKPSQQIVAFMRVDNIEKLSSFVKKNGWNKISEIETQHWGGKECDVTTIDGGIIKFFQLD